MAGSVAVGFAPGLNGVKIASAIFGLQGWPAHVNVAVLRSLSVTYMPPPVQLAFAGTESVWLMVPSGLVRLIDPP